MKFSIGDKIELHAEKIVHGGTALAHRDGSSFFIYGALPGEDIIVRIIKRRKGVWHCEVIEVKELSPLRIEAECPHFGSCGGCTWQHMDYKTQIEFKRDIFDESLTRLGGFENVILENIVQSPLAWEYRNKMEFAFGKDENGVFLGLHRRGRFDVLLPVAKDCLLVPEDVRNVCAAVEEMSQGEAPYEPISGKGYIRFLTIRRSFANENMLLGITVTQQINPEIFAFWFEELSRKFPGKIVGGYLTVNPGGSSSSGDVVHLFGEQELEEYIGEKKFTLSPTSFFQTNPVGAKQLYDTAKEYAALSGKEILWDLYCGTGTIGLYLSDSAREVVGIEENSEAVDDARRNTATNGVENAHYICGDVRKILYRFKNETRPNPDVIIIDPPRAGMAKKAVQRITAFKPKRIVYISCNPATLARDAAMICENGYNLAVARPVDMFPQTYHVETLAILKRRSRRKGRRRVRDG